MESVWGDETKERLQELFTKIINATENVEVYEDDNVERPCLRFDDFISYFSPSIGHYNDQNEEEHKERLKDWKDIKDAVKDSPLSIRNRRQREKEQISASKYRERLNTIEKLINLLEEALIFTDSNRIRDKKSGNNQTEGGMVENEQLFWRKKILVHREFVRFYQDVILHEIINENNKMKKKMDKLLKLNKWNKKIKDSENEWYKKNEHLLQIEQSYYALLKKQKNQQNTMKEVEKCIKQRDEEINSLKSKLREMQKQMNDQNKLIYAERSECDERDRLDKDDGKEMTVQQIASMSDGVLNKKLVILRDEIAAKKDAIERQLNSMTRHINREHDNSLYAKQEKIKHDRI